MCYRARLCLVAIFMSLSAAVILMERIVFAQAQDTQRIVFLGDANTKSIYSANLDGTGLIRLVNDAVPAGLACSSTGRIAFSSSRTGNKDIYAMNWDGTNQIKVTTNTSDDYYPAWSPDGKKIVFARYESFGAEQLWVINADGSGEKRLTSPNTGYSYQPAWSPDGSKIAFSSNRSGGQQIWVINADGSNPVNLTKTGNMAQYPSWSPDGTKVVFIRSNWPSSQVKIINSDGTGEQVLVGSASNSNETAWSPDGKRIAFASTLSGGTTHKIHLVNADGSNLVKMPNNENGGRSPCFQAMSTISFAEPAYSVGEAVGTATFVVKRTGASSGQLTAKVNVTDVTASAADYRLAPGALDPTFAQLGAGTPYHEAGMALQPDGKLLVGRPVRRYNRDGTLDASFTVATMNGSAQAIAVQPDGKIIISGDFTTIGSVRQNHLARLNPDGSLDSTFNAHEGLNDWATAIVVQTDGKILIGGYFSSVNLTSRQNVARLNADGSLDTMFQPAWSGTVYALALHPDGKVLVAGAGVKRLNPDGSADVAFILPQTTPTLSVKLQLDGKILIGGAFKQVNGAAASNVARLNPDGMLDTSFNTGTGPNQAVNTLVVQTDGKVIIGGVFTSYNGAPVHALARLHPDGSLDPSFRENQPAVGTPSIYSMLLQADGKILIGGDLVMVGPNFNRSVFARLENDLFVMWADGDMADKTISLPINDDLLDETDETLTLTLNPLSVNTVTGSNTATTLTINDNDVPPSFTSELPPGLSSRGVGYSHTFTATGFPAPTFTVTAGSLPPGLFLTSSGLLSGATTTAGMYSNITVTASNGVSPAASQTFSIKVNTVPTTNLDNYNLTEDSKLTIAAPGVLGNDTDADNDALTAELIATTTRGALTLSGDGSFTYTPNENFNGSDTFTYRVTDGNTHSISTTVYLSVMAVNDAPVNNLPVAQVVVENSPLVFSAAQANLLSVTDVDAVSSLIRLTLVATNGTITLRNSSGLIFNLGDGAADAVLTFTGNLSNINAALDGLSFIPTKGFSGGASLEMKSSDLGNTGSGGVLTDTDALSISVLDGGEFQFGAPAYSVDEKAGAITITVARTGGSAGAAAVNYSTSNGSAAAGSDYTSARGTLNFAAGEISKTFAINITDDNSAEENETVNLTLGGALGSGALGNPASVVLSIIDDDSSTMQFSAPSYQFSEGDGRAIITLTRAGDISSAATVDYRTIDSDTFTVGCADAVGSQGAAYGRCDFATAVGTMTFAPGETQKQIAVPLIDDAHVESPESFQLRLSNVSGAVVISTSVASVTIQDNDAGGAPNPALAHPFFMRQQYLDFLSREPDANGFNAWLGLLNNCANAFGEPSTPSGCDRIYVSGEGFFRSQEFQLKGFYAFRFYKVAFNRLPDYTEIISDMSFVAGQTAEEVYARKAQLPTLITGRPEFKTAYDGMTNAQYVSTLMSRYQLQQVTTPDPAQPDGGAKVTLTLDELTGRLNANTLTRAQVLRAVADSETVGAQEFNHAFVGMQYYGYLRRKPDAAGFNAWLTVLQAGDVRTMVNGFLNSTEYKLRFGLP